MSDFIESFRDGRRDPWNLFFSVVVFLGSLVVYLMTVQRTLSFWDCGEFITCAHILGVPHPPGTPLFVLVGHVFSFFPIGDDLSLRINIISCIASAFAAMFGYLVAAWLIKKWFVSESFTGWKRVTVYLGGLIGGFFMAFGRTNWGNSVEAEVYGASMFFMMVTIYLMLLWVDHHKEARGEAYLVLMAYLSTLAIGVHMTSYMVVLVAFPLIFVVDEKYRKSWQIWITYVVVALVVYEVTPFLIAATAWAAITCVIYYWKKISQGWIYTIIIPLIVILLYMLRGGAFVPVFTLSFVGWSLLTIVVHGVQPVAKFWRISFLIVLAALLGYSVQMYIPIRAAEKPVMNMNSPDNWKSFQSFLDRKQYGSENMLMRMFHRRGEWKNQFGNHRRMGFWGFFSDQYGFVGKRFLILFFFGLYGCYYCIKKHWKSGVFIFLITLAGTVGLVLYMNFADGTHENKLLGEGHLEVRDRDYFWTPGFVMFGLLIGVGIASLFDMVRTMLSSRKVPSLARNAVLSCCCLSLLLPSAALSHNYFINDRSRNFIPYDYAWNILQSARKDAVLFTNGDNDTFPVWCLQYVYHVRPDVKIANLSLINTPWYIEQLKNYLGIPIGYSDKQIRGLRHIRTPDGIYRVQDQMIDNIITTNGFKIPIEFAVTVSQSNKIFRGKSLDPYLQMEGMSLMLYPTMQPNAINMEKTHDFYWNVFKYRGVNDSTVYKDENAARLVNNYISGFMVMADSLQREGRVDEAAAEVHRAIDVIGGGLEPWAYLCRMYALHNRIDDAMKVLEEAPDTLPKKQLKLFIATALKDKGRKEEAGKLYKKIYAESPDWRDAFNELFRFYYDNRMQTELVRLLHDWTTRHPEDTDVRQAYEQLKKEVPELIPPESSALDSQSGEQELTDSGTGN